LVGPKVEATDREVEGTRYQVKNHVLEGWVYEEIPLRDVRNTTGLLVRILIGKIEDESRFADILRNIPIVQQDPNWRCRTWVAHVLAALKEDGKAVGTSVLDWDRIEPVARQYAGDKTRAGRFRDALQASKPKPTYDMLGNRETVP